LSINERIKYLINISCGGKQRAFAKLLDTSPQVINNMLNRNGAPSFKLIQQLFRKFPELSPQWLILGEGDVGETFKEKYIHSQEGNIFIVQEPAAIYKTPTTEHALLQQKVSSLAREIELLEKIIRDKEILIDHLRADE